MHPDEAVELAMQDLRFRAPNVMPTSAPAAPHRAPGLLRAYFSLMRWYVTEGRTPAAASIEVGHLPRPRFRPEPAARSIDVALHPLAVGVNP